jgi:hypothetical protein
VALLLESYIKPHEKFFIPNYDVHQTDRFPGLKGRHAVAVRKGVTHNHVHLPPLLVTEPSGICVPIRNIEVLLAAVYKLGGAWSDADVINLRNLRNTSL